MAALSMCLKCAGKTASRVRSNSKVFSSQNQHPPPNLNLRLREDTAVKEVEKLQQTTTKTSHTQTTVPPHSHNLIPATPPLRSSDTHNSHSDLPSQDNKTQIRGTAPNDAMQVTDLITSKVFTACIASVFFTVCIHLLCRGPDGAPQKPPSLAVVARRCGAVRGVPEDVSSR
ncbi:hypothetical protein BU26DRAFT_299911 [Trematosphaeria pertusa]|uniref:Uncharacterized protein n=1 Tax=Trematosphaeria pertusa TaxID=390896 RepID=A0A6A6IIB1_9PLEO|nr:uncharacterized protein BU26DRAFT_299911 [Trematosphaeria pertusa]KAF2250314.1 hypothetical protein BU26DRAFT_299911 [Trematosphaeria pertusa]